VVLGMRMTRGPAILVPRHPQNHTLYSFQCEYDQATVD
jgi:hypothetical protein